MTQGEITNAYSALIALRAQRMAAAAAWDIYDMISACSGVIEFQAGEERKILDEMGLTTDKEGNIQFKQREQYESFVSRMNEIHALPAEIDKAEVEIDLDEPANRTIEVSAQEMDALKGLVTFKKGGKRLVHG